MNNCKICGEEIIFRTIDGAKRVYHIHGGDCGGSGASSTSRNGGTFSYRWPHHAGDFRKPTACPICGDKVYFIRHNGGSVWLDEIGWPWPKHTKCFGDDPYYKELVRLLKPHQRLATDAAFGVVLETETSRPNTYGRIAIRCSDGTEIDQEFESRRDFSQAPGSLVVIAYDGSNGLSLHWVLHHFNRNERYTLLSSGDRRSVDILTHKRLIILDNARTLAISPIFQRFELPPK